MHKLLPLFIIIFLFIHGCTFPEPTQTVTQADVPNTDAIIIVEDIPEQKEYFTLNRATITDTQLAVTLGFNYACENVIVRAYSTAGQGFMESAPAQTNVYLVYETPDEACDAALSRGTFSFDLTPLIELYAQSYQRNDPLILNVIPHDNTQETISVLYTP